MTDMILEDAKMPRTFFFSDQDKNVICKEFASYEEAENFAEDNGYHYYHPNKYGTEEAVRKRMEEYGDTKYTFATCPHLYCRDCKFFGEKCKRVDHKGVKFHKSPIVSYHYGEYSIPCHDFEPAHPDYADFKDWNGIDDIWPVFVDTWLQGKTPEYVIFHLGDDFDNDYEVPFDLFFNGGMIKDGVLMAAKKMYYVFPETNDSGKLLFKIVAEKIDGVVIATGEVLRKDDERGEP